MISQYSNPKDIDREFWEDYLRACYWLNKKCSPKQERFKILDDGWEVFNFRQDYAMSDTYYYDSPQTGNRWLMFITARRGDNGDMKFCSRCVLYQMTEKFMTIMIPMVIVMTDSESEEREEVSSVNIYTAHMFQRMADKDRLGVDMTDRIKVIRNFVEFVVTGWSDTRPPRKDKGEHDTQIMLRTPASWIRGHVIQVGNRLVTIYRTFWTDRSMSYAQLKDVRSFKRFADAKMNNKHNKQ